MARRSREEYSKVIVFGTASVDGDGRMQLSDTGKRRGDRAAEAFYRDENKNILVTGGYSKALFASPPEQKEAWLLADYLMSAYKIPRRALFVEEESTTTEENLRFSLEQYPEYFEQAAQGKEVIALVSQADHLARIALLRSGMLGCPDSQFRDLIAYQPLQRVGTIHSISSIALDRSMAAASD